MEPTYTVRIECSHLDLCILANALREHRQNCEDYYDIGSEYRVPTLAAIDRMAAVVNASLARAEADFEAAHPRPVR